MNDFLSEIKNEIQDPLSNAVSSLFGLSYLFPYQRLVMTNILEAAEAAGISINLPVCQSDNIASDKQENFNLSNDDQDDSNEYSDRETSGRQIVILPTGAGKSLCFQLPAMLLEGITLVIYPILSLMADQQRSLDERGFSPVIIRGGQSKEERDEIWSKLKSGQSKFIIANPEVLLTAQVEEKLKDINIVHVVIDEAHCVSEWGESFRPSYLEINKIINAVSPPLVTAFTATASSPVLEKIKKYVFGELEAQLIMGNPDRPNICYTAKGCIVRNLAVRDLIIENERPAIVFCSSRPGTEKIASYLRSEFSEMGFSWRNEIKFYHAGLSREEKTQVEKWFFGNKEAVLCATCAYGMGVDKADIRTVIHRDCAPSVEAYLQESGRAGRDGRQSKAILLWGPDDEAALARVKTEANRGRIASLLNYSRDTKHCRRHALLKLLNFNSDGEVPENFCCDVCVSGDKPIEASLREEKSIMEFFRKNKRRFTINTAAQTLSESNTIHWSQEDASAVIQYLLKTGKLKKINKFFWKNRITINKKIRIIT